MIISGKLQRSSLNRSRRDGDVIIGAEHVQKCQHGEVLAELGEEHIASFEQGAKIQFYSGAGTGLIGEGGGFIGTELVPVAEPTKDA